MGPNARFLDYISQALPSFGENDVVLATCRELAGVSTDAVDPYGTARLKGGSDLAGALAGLLRVRQAPAGDFTVRAGRELVHLSGGEVATARDAAVTAAPGHNPARQVFKELLVGALTDAMQRDMGDLLEQIDADAERMTGMDLDRFTGAAQRRPEGAAGPGPVHELDVDAIRAGLLDDAGVDRAVEVLWPRLVPGDLVKALLTSLLLRGPDDPWTDADVPLLDEAASLVDGPPERTYGHVVVDEAQELTAMQWRMIVRHCPARAMTLVGDFAQAGPVATARGWKEALSPYVGPRFTGPDPGHQAPLHHHRPARLTTRRPRRRRGRTRRGTDTGPRARGCSPPHRSWAHGVTRPLRAGVHSRVTASVAAAVTDVAGMGWGWPRS